MNKVLLLTILSTFVLLASATTYYKEEFDANWADRWVQSNFKESDGTRGDFVRTAGKFYGDAEADQGVQTSQDARFYAYTATFPKFSNEGKDLVLQYTVKHEQKIDCGGGYLKLVPSTVDQKNFNGDSDYNIMFGPDICGSSTKKVHLIFNYKGKNHLLKKNVPAESDEFTHLYTLILRPDNTYEIQIDQKEVAKGSLKEDWDILEPKEIKDPKASKPADWVDAKDIADPEDTKPAGYDDLPAQIADPEATKPEDWDLLEPKEIKDPKASKPADWVDAKEIADPDAKKPEDWDDELDGEWEAPQIANPEFKGEWKAKTIPNPEYKGEWVHPLIPNPAFVDDENLYLYADSGAVGFELWQVKAGTIFDNIFVADTVAEAKEHAEATWVKTAKNEKVHKEEQDKKQREVEEEERKKKEAEEKVAEKDDEEDEEPATKKEDKDEL
jgi:calreticulin